MWNKQKYKSHRTITCLDSTTHANMMVDATYIPIIRAVFLIIDCAYWTISHVRSSSFIHCYLFFSHNCTLHNQFLIRKMGNPVFLVILVICFFCWLIIWIVGWKWLKGKFITYVKRFFWAVLTILRVRSRTHCIHWIGLSPKMSKGRS